MLAGGMVVLTATKHPQSSEIRRELGKASSHEHKATLKAEVRGREAQINQVTSGNSVR